MKKITKYVKALATRSEKVDASFSIYEIPASQFEIISVEGMTSFLTKEGAIVEVKPAGEGYATVIGKFANGAAITLIAC